MLHVVNTVTNCQFYPSVNLFDDAGFIELLCIVMSPLVYGNVLTDNKLPKTHFLAI